MPFMFRFEWIYLLHPSIRIEPIATIMAEAKKKQIQQEAKNMHKAPNEILFVCSVFLLLSSILFITKYFF